MKGMNLGVLRDIYCGQNVAELKKWNCFEENLAFYCCGIWREQQAHYMVFEREDELYEFLYHAWLNGEAPTVYQNVYEKVHLSLLHKDEEKTKRKRQFARQTMDALSVDFVRWLHNVSGQPSDGCADRLFLQWQKRLIGVFRQDDLQLFQGTLELAVMQNLISQVCYSDLKCWLNRVQLQMRQDTIPAGNYQRVMSGFAFYKDNKWGYFFDAQPMIVQKRWYEYVLQGIYVTSVWSKLYVYQREGELPLIRKKFAADLKQQMNPAYLDFVLSLWQLPVNISFTPLATPWAEQLEHNEAMRTTVQFYTTMWHK